MNDIMMFIKDVGFPIFVACYCLFKIDKRLKEICCELKKMNNRGGDK